MDDTTTKTMTIETIPVETHLDIIAAVLQLEDDYIDIAVATHLRQLRHASPTMFRVWTVHGAVLTRQVALERLAALKAYALESRRRLVRATFRYRVRRAALRLAPVLDDHELRHTWRLGDNLKVAVEEWHAADDELAMVSDRNAHLRACLEPGYPSGKLNWRRSSSNRGSGGSEQDCVAGLSKTAWQY
ncbi:hypothetical protein FN846DRAFT_907721 [Sphaerosporella brunnea]|uniref:Uncharacterized protein n=1 Tax=Sphaerosporella brunnea TaxID=1250544 RepID=A0A5J5EVH5_9PEZI|nr:hypothetical protein FN846DRAFT_907721 [Sphaerosporella brunnea]